MTAALRVKVAMAAANLTINKVAQQSGVSHHTMQKMAMGQVATSWQNMVNVANVLNVPVEWLTEGRNPPKWLLEMIESPELASPHD